MAEKADDEDAEFTSDLGPLRIDWARALGYYGAIGAAVAFEVIAPPLAVFVAVVPLLKLLRRREASWLERATAAVIEGAGKPVGGDAEGVVRAKWVDEEKARDEERKTAPREPAQPARHADA